MDRFAGARDDVRRHHRERTRPSSRAKRSRHRDRSAAIQRLRFRRRHVLRSQDRRSILVAQAAAESLDRFAGARDDVRRRHRERSAAVIASKARRSSGSASAVATCLEARIRGLICRSGGGGKSDRGRKAFASPPSGRVGDWRAGLGRSLCSLLARSFVGECHTISAVPRFQPPPRRTQHADFPHCALLFASPQGLWGLSAFALTYILRLRSCKSMDAFVISSLPSLWWETLQTAGLLRSTGVTPPQRYYEPIRHPLAFDRLPG